MSNIVSVCLNLFSLCHPGTFYEISEVCGATPTCDSTTVLNMQKGKKNLSLSTHPHADEKFYSPQNIPAASQQNSVVAFSYTTEIIQLVQHHSSLQSWFKKTLLTLFFKEIFTVAAELRALVLTSSEVDARDWPHARSVDPSPARSCFYHHLSKMLQRCKAPEILCGLQISTCLSTNITLAFVKWQQSLMLNLSEGCKLHFYLPTRHLHIELRPLLVWLE